MKKFAAILVFLLTVSLLFAEKTAQEKRNDFIAAAKDMLGTPYVYGGTSKSGIDCSGFVYVAAKNSGNGVIPRTAEAIYNYSTPVTASERQPGDLVFFAVNSKVNHVGIYLGNNQFIHSASDGPKTGVIISKLSEKYWKNHYYSSGRIITAVKEVAKAEEPQKKTEKKQPVEEKEKPAPKKQQSASEKQQPVTEKKQPATEKKPPVTEKKQPAEEPKQFPENEEKYSRWNNDSPSAENSFLEENFAFTAAASLNYSIYVKGFSLQAELTLKKLPLPLSFVIKPTYTHDGTISFLSQITTPVCVKVGINRYFSAYTGFVLNGERFSVSKPLLRGTDIHITTPFFPGIFGLSLETPKLSVGKTRISLAQEVSYTNHKAADGYPKLTFRQAIEAGLELNTFVRVELH